MEKQNELLIARVFQKIEEMGFEKILNLPANTTRETALLQQGFGFLPYAMLRFDNDWSKSSFLMFKAIEYALNVGHTVFSGHSFALSGPMVCTMGNYEMGYQLVQLGLKLGERFHDKGAQCQALQILSFGVSHWRRPIKEGKAHALKGIQLGQEGGNLFYAVGCVLNYQYNCFAEGQNLKTVIEEWDKKYGPLTLKYNIEISNYYMIGLRWVMNDLVDEKIESLEFNETKNSEADYSNVAFPLTLHNYYTHKAQTCFILQDNDQALHFLNLVEPQNLYTFFSLFEYNFYGSLIRLKQYEDDSQVEHLEKVKANQAQMQIWVDNCPENFLHKYQLVTAEQSRIEGKDFGKLLFDYDEAIKNARKNGFIQDAAIANELCAQYLIRINLEKIAQPYLKEAYQLYKQWGASAKTTQMEEKHAAFLGKTQRTSGTIGTRSTYLDNTFSTSSAGTTKRALDLDTVLKANTTLSQQVRLNDLIAEMLKLLTKSSGANKITFLRKGEEDWLVEADQENEQILLSTSKIFESYQNIPKTLVAYVMRSKEYILLDDVTQNQQFSKDPYIQKNQSKSVFVIPVKKQGEILAILYLENNLNTGVFHKKRYDLINALVTQLAISMENTLLYENLEDKVHERTLELQEAYEETQVMNEELRQTQEELQTQRDYVEQQNSELKKYNRKLESSEEILLKMNNDIQEKNKQLAQTNTQIALSINSAKTIQEAILPYEGKFGEYFAEYFIINRPKDVVSGDFYWFKESQDRIILVVADCTGHGVPGAFMTLIGANLLDKIVDLEGITYPDLILEALHKEIQYFLKQEHTQNNNGMDAVVITLEKQSDYKKLSFAGAKNNLLLWSNNELKELKGTRKSIGGIQNEAIRFENQEMLLRKGDLLYLGSDGLEDQNDIKRKKFGRNRIKTLIKEVYQNNLNEQKESFEKSLAKHMQNELQRDDILWMGVKI